MAMTMSAETTSEPQRYTISRESNGVCQSTPTYPVMWKDIKNRKLLYIASCSSNTIGGTGCIQSDGAMCILRRSTYKYKYNYKYRTG